MPTAARKQREAEKRRQTEQDAADLAEFDRQLALLRAMRGDVLQVGFSANNDLIFELPSYTHMKGGLGGCDENGNTWHHPMVGKAGSAANADNALDRAKSLKRKFPHLWGKGAYAEHIASKSMSAIRLEKPLSAKTIRRYFKLVP